MNLTNILADAYRRLSFGTSPGSEVSTRLTAFANAEIREILSDPILSKLRRRPVSFSTVADLPTCVLPQAAVRIYSIVDRTNQRELDEETQEWIREQDPGQSFSSSAPEAFAIVNYTSPIARQPSDSSQLLAKSSSASDTAVVAYIEFINSDGYIQAANATLTGATALNLGAADVVSVLDFYLSAAPVGEVTLHEDTGSGTELAKIGIGRTRARYTMLEIFPTPATAMTLYADVDTEITDLVNGTDEPVIPDEYCEVIVHGIRKREYQKREKKVLADGADTDRRPWIAKLHHHMHRKASSESRRERRSQLGPYYPAGS